MLSTSNSLAAHEQNLDDLNTNTHIRTSITHGFWFPKLVAFCEEWYRERLFQQGGHTETGELPEASDPDWFFDPANPSNSIMGGAIFRWGLLDEVEARLAIHNMITSYTDREYSILRDGVWIYAMANL